MKPVVIARFSIVMVAFMLAAAAAILAFLCRSFLPAELFAVLGVLLFALGIHRRNAIWIMDGRLYLRGYPFGFTFSFPTSDIQDVTLGEENDEVFNNGFHWTYVIVIKLRDGRNRTIGQYPLMPSLRVALSRLRAALGLPQTAA